MKKFNLKKIGALTLALVMAAGCLSGCSGGNSNGGSGDVRVVKVYSSEAGAKAVWEELVNEFNKTTGKEKGIEIEWVTYAADYGTIMDVARQNDQLPDICTVSKQKMAEYIKTDDIIAINDVEGGEDFLKEYNPIVIPEDNLIDGKVYRVYSGVVVPGLIYNKDLFKKAGLVDENGEAKPPKTLEEMREYAKKLTDKSKGVYGYSFPLKFGWSYTVNMPMRTSFGPLVKVDYDDVSYDYSNWSNAIPVMLDLRDDGSLFPGAESLDNDTSRAYFAEGKIGMMPAMSWDVGVLTDQFPAKCDWAVAPYPTEKGEAAYPGAASLAGAYMMTKTALVSEPEKVMEVYKFIYSVESRKAMYENNIAISIKDDVLSSADTAKLLPQFKQFAEAYDPNTEFTVNPSVKLEGDSSDVVFSSIWSGATTLEAGLADLSKRYTDAFRKGVEDGSIVIEKYRQKAMDYRSYINE